MRFTSPDQLKEYKATLEQDQDPDRPVLIIPAGTCGVASGAEAIIRVVRETLLREGLADEIEMRVTGCHGFCEMEPSILVRPGEIFYPALTEADAERVVMATARGEIAEELVWTDSATGAPSPCQPDVPFFQSQTRTILSQNEHLALADFDSYVANGGYSALLAVVERGEPEWVLSAVESSGLRGRGGAGFSTGRKWGMLAKQLGANGKFLICNADEGDPGAYMDRSILEGNPHSILEGMLIGAYATGATEGIIYIRHEYPMAIEHLHRAIEDARESGLLGQSILGTGFSFDIFMVEGAGAFVCGEETALIRSIEGKMGEPKQRPPFPIQRGLHGKPTSINNVETWANIPVIIGRGPAAFAQVGAEGNAGTKIFSLVGKIRNTGLVEAPMGMPIKQIVYDIGGGPSGKAKIKAVQTGGPSGGCIPARLFDLPIDYDSLAEAGAIMGSGGMIVMDEDTCMVDVAKYFMGFLKDESCGKCFTCRKGTQRMYEILEDITNGAGTLEHLDLLEEVALAVKDTTMCGLGQTAANPVLSTLRYFREEYERHVVDKRCDAFVCENLVGAPCQSACPVDTEPWRYVALIQAGRLEEAYQVIREANPLPAVSGRVCDRTCERRCKLGTSGGEAIGIRALKRYVTDRVAPSVFSSQQSRTAAIQEELGSTFNIKANSHSVAVVGAGPAGLSAAHYLSNMGYAVTLFDAESEPGGMLLSAIPPYRLPRDVVRDEVSTLLNERIDCRYGMRLGRDFTIDELFEAGYGAVFLALGADKSRSLGIEGETVDGIYSSIEFLKAFNLHGQQWARGRVGIVGGGNSAVDAARVAIRQKDVESVTLIYRRACEEMPAYAEEVDAAVEEGILLETLVSPGKVRYIEAALNEGVQVETYVSPVKTQSEQGRLTGIECVRNTLGEIDSSGRRSPVPKPGSEFQLPLDTLIVAIGERPDSDCLESMGLSLEKDGRLSVDPDTLSSHRPGVFAGGDLTSGPNTVVEAIAAGKHAAVSIDHYLRGAPLKKSAKRRLPSVYVPPQTGVDEYFDTDKRIDPPVLPADSRKKSFAEVELAFGDEEAIQEASRCLRCDLQFTCELAGKAVTTEVES